MNGVMLFYWTFNHPLPSVTQKKSKKELGLSQLDIPSFPCLITNCCIPELSQLDEPPYWQRQQGDAIYKIYENNSDFFGSDDVATTWATTDDMLKKCEMEPPTDEQAEEELKKCEMETDLPKSLETYGNDKQNTAKLDDTLIELSHQLADAKLSQSDMNSTYSLSTVRSKNTQPAKTVTATTIMAAPLKNRLALAQQIMVEQDKITAQKIARTAVTEKKVMELTFPAGFIVDNKAIEEKYREHREKDLPKNKQKSRFNKAKAMEEW